MGASQQALLIGGAAAAESGLLVGYTTSLWGAYALQKVSSLYAGSAIRVRESGGNTEADIGFSGTALDTAALATHCGANDGFIVTWYDQSGGGNNLTHATTTKQPKIVDAGTYIGEALFDGVDDELISANNSGTPAAFSVYLAGRGRQTDSVSARTLFLHSTTTGCTLSRATADADDYRVNAGNGTGTNGFDDAMASDATTYAFVADRAQATIATELALYKNGAAQSSLATSGSTVAGNFSAAAWALGSSNGSQYSRLAVRAFLIYETAHNSTDAAAISALIKPTAPTLGIDSYTTGLWGLYSLRRQLTAYAGSSIRVRRSSDNVEADIGFSSGLLDTAALLTHCGAGNGFVTKWYDQSGSSRDFVQATAAAQPRIVNAGVVDRGITFDGSNDVITSNTNSGAVAAFTFFVKGNLEAAVTQIMLEHSANYNSNDAAVIYYDAAALSVGSHKVAAAGYARSDFAANIVGSVACARTDRAQVTGAAQAALFMGGALLTRGASGDSGTLPTGNFAAAAWNLGARNGGTVAATVDFESVVIYEAAVTDANVERISRALG